jgi:hypothetical protein
MKMARYKKTMLQTTIPKIHWIESVWQPSTMGNVMEQISAKRNAILDQGLRPDMLQRDIKRSKISKSDVRGQNNGADKNDNDTGAPASGNAPRSSEGDVMIPANSATDTTNYDGSDNAMDLDSSDTKDGQSATRRTSRSVKRSGPCVFGCTTTTNIRNGVQIWKTLPKPCPWPEISDGSVLCNRCYSKGIALRNRQAAERSMRSSLDSLDRKRRLERDHSGATTRNVRMRIDTASGTSQESINVNTSDGHEIARDNYVTTERPPGCDAAMLRWKK